MYNTDLPTRAELPTHRQLLKATLGAAIVASVLLITLVLPAEYAIDPTGIGRSLGLTEMGEIKQSLAEEASKALVDTKKNPEEKTPSIKTSAGAVENLPRTDSQAAAEKESSEIRPLVAEPSEMRSVTLQPGAATELKLDMSEGAKVNYHWSVNQGHVNYDTHGDSPTLNYYSYGKGRQETQQTGQLVAAFDGQHGWFWRNRSKVTVVVTLEVQGEFKALKQML